MLLCLHCPPITDVFLEGGAYDGFTTVRVSRGVTTGVLAIYDTPTTLGRILSVLGKLHLLERWFRVCRTDITKTKTNSRRNCSIILIYYAALGANVGSFWEYGGQECASDRIPPYPCYNTNSDVSDGVRFAAYFHE